MTPTRTTLTILAGAILLAWPALLNAYPIMFSDSYGYIEQGYEGVAWDKPWIYGPLIRAIHLGRSLWPVVVAQAALLSTMLWLLQRSLLATPRRTHHLLLCALLAIGSAAPWFVAFIMPDNFTPICVIGLAILTLGPGRLRPATLAAVGLITTVTLAAHFSHFIMAAATIATIALLRWRTLLRDLWRPALPLVAALLLILATNVIGRGIVGISPTGSVFALARLVADGPAARYIESVCPQAGYHLCAWAGHLPTNSDEFLWSGDGPMYKDDYGAERLAPEASEIVRNTVLAYPGPVLLSAARNTLEQLELTTIGDTLGDDYLKLLVRDTVIAYFPPAELTRFEAGLQFRAKLRPLGEAFNPLHLTLLALGAATTTLILLTRRHPSLARLAAIILTAVLANAFTTGALSGPHDRYQARITWLVILPPAFLLAETLNSRRRAILPPPPAADENFAG